MINLELTNYRRFQEKTAVSFHPGLTIVSGKNGTGKSTLVEAISYSLFGPARGQASEIQSDNATDNTVVTCELVIDDRCVRIHRSNDGAELWIDDILEIQGISGSVSIVNNRIKQLLGNLTKDQFENTYFALQGDTIGLVKNRKSQDRDNRRKIIEAILQINVLRSAVEAQKQNRSDALTNVTSQGRFVSQELKLDSSALETLRELEWARKLETRGAAAKRFLAIVESVVELRKSDHEASKSLSKEAEKELFNKRDAVKTCEQLYIQAKAEREKSDNLQSQFQELDTQIAQVQGRQDQIKEDIEDLVAQINEAEKHADTAKEYDRLQEQILQMQDRRTRLGEIEAKFNALTQAQLAYKNIQDQLQESNNAEEECRQLERAESMAKDAWNNLQSDPTLDAYQDWSERKIRFEERIIQAKQALKTLKKVPQEARCPTCDQALTEHSIEKRVMHLVTYLNNEKPPQQQELDKEKERLDEEKAEWEKAKGEAYKRWQDLSKPLIEARQNVQHKTNLTNDKKIAWQNLQTAQSNWDELGELAPFDPQEESQITNSMAKLITDAKRLSSQAEQYSRLSGLQEEMEKKSEGLPPIDSNLKALRAKQQQIGYDPEAHERAKEEEAEVQTAFNAAREKRHEAELLLQKRQGEETFAFQTMEKAGKYGEELATAITTMLHEDRLYTLLDSFQSYFFEANTSKIAERASQLLSLTVTDQSILGLEFDEKNYLYFRDASHVRHLVNRLSGGEKALAGLCLRIALAEQAQAITQTRKIRFLVLDEVLSSFDDDRRDAVQRVFQDVQQHGIFEHIIMVTHLDTVKQNWQANMLEVRKNGSKTSEVIPLSAMVDPLPTEDMEV